MDSRIWAQAQWRGERQEDPRLGARELPKMNFHNGWVARYRSLPWGERISKNGFSQWVSGEYGQKWILTMGEGRGLPKERILTMSKWRLDEKMDSHSKLVKKKKRTPTERQRKEYSGFPNGLWSSPWGERIVRWILVYGWQAQTGKGSQADPHLVTRVLPNRFSQGVSLKIFALPRKDFQRRKRQERTSGKREGGVCGCGPSPCSPLSPYLPSASHPTYPQR